MLSEGILDEFGPPPLPVKWWLRDGKSPPFGYEGRVPLVGLDRQDGRVVFVGGPILERGGRQYLGPRNTRREVDDALGDPAAQFGADADYFAYAEWILVRFQNPRAAYFLWAGAWR